MNPPHRKKSYWNHRMNKSTPMTYISLYGGSPLGHFTRKPNICSTKLLIEPYMYSTYIRPQARL